MNVTLRQTYRLLSKYRAGGAPAGAAITIGRRPDASEGEQELECGGHAAEVVDRFVDLVLRHQLAPLLHDPDL